MKKCSPRLGIDQELDRAGVHVVARRGRACTASSRMRWRSAGVEVRRRRDLDDLLVAQLHRAVALEEVHDVALAVGQHLHLDVARPRDELLEEHRAVAERRLGLALAAGEGLGHLRGRRHARACRARRRRPRPSASPDSRWLRPAPCAASLDASAAGAAGHDRDALRLGEARAPATLSPNSASVCGRGPDEAPGPRPGSAGRRRRSPTGSRSPDARSRSRSPCAAAMRASMSR